MFRNVIDREYDRRAGVLNVLGIQIERKTDILALSAFLLSAGGIATQAGLFLYVFWRGPVVEMFPPERILIRAHDLNRLEDTWVRIGSRMAYTNSGSVGYNTVLRKEIIKLEIDGKIYRQSWQSFETFDYVDDTLVSVKSEPANPIPVVAGSALAHDTYFFPFREFCRQNDQSCDEWRNYLKFFDFIEEARKIDKIRFTLTAKMYGENDETTSCTILIDENVISQLEKRGWHAPSCLPVAARVARMYRQQDGAFASESGYPYLTTPQVPSEQPSESGPVRKFEKSTAVTLFQPPTQLLQELPRKGTAGSPDNYPAGTVDMSVWQQPLPSMLENPPSESARFQQEGEENGVESPLPEGWHFWPGLMPPELPPELPPGPPPELMPGDLPYLPAKPELNTPQNAPVQQ